MDCFELGGSVSKGRSRLSEWICFEGRGGRGN